MLKRFQRIEVPNSEEEVKEGRQDTQGPSQRAPSTRPRRRVRHKPDANKHKKYVKFEHNALTRRNVDKQVVRYTLRHYKKNRERVQSLLGEYRLTTEDYECCCLLFAQMQDPEKRANVHIKKDYAGTIEAMLGDTCSKLIFLCCLEDSLADYEDGAHTRVSSKNKDVYISATKAYIEYVQQSLQADRLLLVSPSLD